MKYRELDPDDQVEIKGGEKFVVVKRGDLLPDGRLRPMSKSETEEEWQAYVNGYVDKLMLRDDLTEAQITAAMRRLFATPDAFKEKHVSAEARLQYQEKTELMIAEKVAATAAHRKKLREDRIIAAAYQQLNATPLVLQANEVSRAHKLLEGTVFQEGDKETHDLEFEHTFVVRHDWLGVLGDTNPELSEWELPYDACLFEFKVGGRVCLVFVTSAGDTKRFTHIAHMSDTLWWHVKQSIPLTQYLERQVAACCVVIEAEVATHEVVRQPMALQAKRKKSGKPLLIDYRVIDLSKKKPRIANPLDTQTPEEQKGRKRLHFCRGHWRQYATHRTRIPWCLKGNPDLGFVNKTYKL